MDSKSPIWDLAEAQRMIDHPAVRLLRSPNAAFTLTFLHRAFKEHHAISVPESHLRARLENFLDEVRELRPGALPRSGSDYLSDWCGPEQLLLKKLYGSEADEPVFELTAAAERTMRWVEELQARAFVGAESRLEMIVRQVEEIVLFSTSDTDVRLEALRTRQREIEAEIEEIRHTNKAEVYSPVQLTERFSNALELARALAADFRELEENFKQLARELAEAHAQPGTTKGGMVGRLLDTHSALKASPQGQSFYAFWNMLSSPERQNHWRELIGRVYRLDAIDPNLRANRLLERLSSRLLVEAERVVRSNERMAATLRRALESVEAGEEQRLRELIREVQRRALASSTNPAESDFYHLQAPPRPFDGMSRRLWQRSIPGKVDGEVSFATHTLDMDTIRRFQDLEHLDLARLRENLRVCLMSAESVALSEALLRFPPKFGIVEVVGYLVIAASDSHHFVADDQPVDVFVQENGMITRWRVPEALFTRDRRIE